MDAHIRFKAKEKEVIKAVRELADKEVRSIAQTVKALAVEALRARKLIKN